MNSSILEISIILILLVANGVFAMTEIAIVSSKKGLLQGLADKGNKGAARAIKLAEDPSRFLSTVQIGITLVGIMAGALSGGTITTQLASLLSPIPFVGEYATEISRVAVIGMLTYLSVIVGELVPKRLALLFPEKIATGMSGPMATISSISSPAVSLLSWSAGSILKLFGVKDSDNEKMSREELTVLVRQGMVTGSINRSESRMMEGVIGFEKLVTYDLMIPRTRIVWIEQHATHEEVWPTLMRSTQGVFPVYDERRDNMKGVVTLKDIYGRLAAGEAVNFGEIMRPALFVPEMQKASVLLETFRSSGQRAAFVLDEFGSVMGMVTLIDVMEAIVGDVPSREEQLASPIRQRTDGSWLIDGLFEIEKLPEHLPAFELPEGGGDEYQTLSGWFMKELGRMPAELDKISSGAWTFEVMDMDGTRVDKVLASRQAVQETPDEAN
ncbi:MAG: HlyC/CorC family transporter [Verrucomicrobiaceae bacterium]|nr:MAG: HlyC/CorC family transporter [Verrucomicrobiaceae bacterium]